MTYQKQKKWNIKETFLEELQILDYIKQWLYRLSLSSILRKLKTTMEKQLKKQRSLGSEKLQKDTMVM